MNTSRDLKTGIFFVFLASHIQYPKITVGNDFYKVVSSKEKVKVDSSGIDFNKVLAM